MGGINVVVKLEILKGVLLVLELEALLAVEMEVLKLVKVVGEIEEVTFWSKFKC